MSARIHTFQLRAVSGECCGQEKQLLLVSFHHDPNSGRAQLRFLRRKFTVNQALLVGGSAARLHLARVNLPLPWNKTEELLESRRSDVLIHVNHHK